MIRLASPIVATVLAVAAAAWAAPARAAVFEIWPSTAGSSEEFEAVANGLGPGDELVLHGGTYSQTGRRALSVQGTVADPIVIRAAAGEQPVLTRPADQIDQHNNIELDNSAHLVIRGIHFKGGSTGIRVICGHHITIEDSEISDTGNNAIALNSGSCTYDAFVIRRNHIHHTGLSSSGSTEGEGMYLGCNNDACRVANAIIEGNYIHHLRATSDGGNDGIEVKVGSYNNVIRDNVIHDTTIGTRFPCIFVYGGGSAVNVVEGNALWNCGEAIQVVSDAVVRNNLILTSEIAGITAAPHAQVGQMRNVTIVNNTIYGHPECLFVRWSGATNMTLTNNAIYCSGGSAVDASGLGGAGITVKSNAVEGSLAGASVDGSRFLAGGSAAAAFVAPGSQDLWPRAGSPLHGAADGALAPALDFNGTVRSAPTDIGAYETEGATANPGWRVGPGFKTRAASGQAPQPPTNLRVR